MGDMDDIVKDFLVESNENLDQLDRDLVTLEKDPTDRDILASIFRTIHTIKGTSGFLGFTRLGSVTHVGESLLSSLRDGRLVLNAEITSALLAMVDAVRQMLVNIENTEKEGEGNYDSLIETLTRLQKGEKKKEKPEAQKSTRASSESEKTDEGPAQPPKKSLSPSSRPRLIPPRPSKPSRRRRIRQVRAQCWGKCWSKKVLRARNRFNRRLNSSKQVILAGLGKSSLKQLAPNPPPSRRPYRDRRKRALLPFPRATSGWMSAFSISS